MTERPDAELVARVRDGDATAFEVLMRRHFRMAFLIALAQLGERADAEDACQDAFVRCWERIDECRNPERVSAWIATVVRNTAHNRRDYLRVRRAAPIEAAAHVTSGSCGISNLELVELRAFLTEALAQVSPVQREVVLLHDLEGWKHAEIAKRLDLSEVMSRRHLSDARKRLRELLPDLETLEVDHD